MKSIVKTSTQVAILVVSLIGLLSLSIVPKSADDKFVSVSKVIESNKVTAQIVGVGGYQESCLSFDLKNTTPDTLFLMLEPGRRVVSEDSSLQDILIVKERKFILPPFASLKVDGYGFCCRATKGSPQKNSKFNIGYMAPPGWVELAEVVNQNNFPAIAVQHAVWVLSDNHSIASIHYEKMAEIDLLRRTVAKIKGIELPWYSIDYVKDTAQLFSNKPEKVYGDFEYYLNRNSIVSINIRSAKGRLMTTLLEGEAQDPGKHVVKLNSNVKNWPKGEYDICVYEDYSNLNLRKRFVLN